jgi:GTP-binding protein
MSTVEYRNIAIIAHVDHGKTTLVDKLLREGGAFTVREEVEERAMDSMDLEREKGITIKAKNASLHWGGKTINIVDTPGHADFGGEVERIMQMVDGVLLVVDAVDGPQAQTRFVLQKALHHGLKPIVVVNKIDREHADVHRVHDQVLELLLDLHANEEQFNCPFIYASARDGFAMRDINDAHQHGAPVRNHRVPHSPAQGQPRRAVQDADQQPGLERLRGPHRHRPHHQRQGQDGRRDLPASQERQARAATVTKVFEFSGMRTSESVTGEAGNIVGIAGFEDLDIGETLCSSAEDEPVPFTDIDPPTLQMQFCVNDGPLAGREGKFLTSRQLRERLYKEIRMNISLKVQDTDVPNIYLVSARGELQIAILVEQMRREGFRAAGLAAGSDHEAGERQEAGAVRDPVGGHAAGPPGRHHAEPGRTQGPDHQHASPRRPGEPGGHIPTRGIIGFETDMVNLTGGRAVMSHMFKEYAPHCGPWPAAPAAPWSPWTTASPPPSHWIRCRSAARCSSSPGDEVYVGMLVGENPRAEDIPVNPTKQKHLTNMRSQGDGKGIMLEPPIVDLPGTRHRIHRPGRVCGGHAEEPAPAQEDPRPHQAQTRKPAHGGRGISRYVHRRDAEVAEKSGFDSLVGTAPRRCPRRAAESAPYL